MSADDLNFYSQFAHFGDDVPDLCREQSISSLGFDELQPSSEGINNTSEDELEYEDVAEAPPKKVPPFCAVQMSH
jgi:hypothetical protein